MDKKEGLNSTELALLFLIFLVLAIIVFFTLNPVHRSAVQRDERRLSDITLLLEGFVFEYERDPSFLYELQDSTMQIGTAEDGCKKNCPQASVAACFNANTRILKHIGDIPFDPQTGTQERTGYYVLFNDSRELIVGSCSVETQESLTVIRKNLELTK